MPATALALRAALTTVTDRRKSEGQTPSRGRARGSEGFPKKGPSTQQTPLLISNGKLRGSQGTTELVPISPCYLMNGWLPLDQNAACSATAGDQDESGGQRASPLTSAASQWQWKHRESVPSWPLPPPSLFALPVGSFFRKKGTDRETAHRRSLGEQKGGSWPLFLPILWCYSQCPLKHRSLKGWNCPGGIAA